MRFGKVILIAALALTSAAASADPLFNCARGLYVADIEATIAQANQTVDDFHDAVAKLDIDKSSTTVATIGAAMMGGAMANEVAAAAEGLRQMAYLRNQFTTSNGRDVILQRLELAMKEASERIQRVSESYGKVQLMASEPEIKALAAAARDFSLKVSSAWSCK